MRKRALSLIIALVLPVVLLCGCNNETESSVSTPESSSSTSESSSSSSESNTSTSESSESIPESSVSTSESSASTSESSASTPESSSSSSESNVSKPAENNSALQKYYDEMIETYFEYVSATVPGKTPEVARGIAEAETAGLEKFGKMTVPKEYAERYSDMMSAAESEREWIKALLDYANGVIDYEGLEKRGQAIRPDSRSEFTTKCLCIIADLNHEPSVVPTDKGKMLEMLSKI